MKFNLIKRNRNGQLKDSDPGFRDACYYVRFQIEGKSFCRSTDCTAEDDADKVARSIYKLELKKSLGLIVETPKLELPVAVAVPTVATFCQFYLTSPGNAGVDGRKANISQLLKALERANPDQEDVGSLPYTSIDGDLAVKWFTHVQETNLRMAHDQVTVMHNKNTANSNFVKMASMFTDHLLEHYEAAGYQTVGFADFRKKGKNRRFTKAVSKGINPYTAPDQTVIDNVLASWLTLTDRNVFIGVGFALSFGLRKGETAQVRWSWLRLLNGGSPALTNVTSGVFKDGRGSLTVRALDPFYSQFMKRLDEMGWRGADDELVLTGGVAELESLCWERLGKWLKSLGWTTDKMSHALRAFSGSKVYMRYGLEAAQKFLRHAKSQTTQDHYLHFASSWPMDDDERAALPERWAAKVTNILPLVAVAA